MDSTFKLFDLPMTAQNAKILFFGKQLDDFQNNNIIYLDKPNIKLDFTDFTFDWALSANYFFNNLAKLEINDIILQIKELARIAKEVRILPVYDEKGQVSKNLGPVLSELQKLDFGIEVKSQAMLRIWAKSCLVSK